MPVVSDTSPILGLAAIGHLELLREQFGAVLIPTAVKEIGFFIADDIYRQILKQAGE